MSGPASTSTILLGGGLLAAAFGLAFVLDRFEPKQRARRKTAKGFAKAQPAKAAAAPAGGYVAVEGTVVGLKGRAFNSPLSGRHCVWARAEARQIGGAKARLMRRPSVQVAAETLCAPFVLDDGSGERIFVDPTDADVFLDARELAESGTIDESTGPEAEFLAKHGVPTESFLGLSKRFWMEEHVIRTKSTIRVAGNLRRVSASPATHGCALVMAADEGGSLCLSDMSTAALVKAGTLYTLGVWLLGSGLVALAAGALMAYRESR